MLPDMGRGLVGSDGQVSFPNWDNFVVFGVVNRYKYKNHEGKLEDRVFIPLCLRYGQTKCHKGDQWLLEVFDVERKDYRTYALDDIRTR